ncbi:MAG: OmpH family outer membrane protein [Candidatus Cloacimonas sp.]|nr:OmpH family outer membrane protein [Candidatus Cloacimonadota bacterium]
MKRVMTLVALIIISSASLLLAQSIKIGYIDTDKIMIESKDTQEAQLIFKNEQAQWEKEIMALDDEVKRLESEYEARKLTLTESGKAQAQEKIEAKTKERRQYLERIFGENGIAVQRNAELLEPIMIKLKESIEKIAIEENYSIVFDAVGGGLLYARPNLDLTDLILKEMNDDSGKGKTK